MLDKPDVVVTVLWSLRSWRRKARRMPCHAERVAGFFTLRRLLNIEPPPPPLKSPSLQQRHDCSKLCLALLSVGIAAASLCEHTDILPGRRLLFSHPRRCFATELTHSEAAMENALRERAAVGQAVPEMSAASIQEATDDATLANYHARTHIRTILPRMRRGRTSWLTACNRANDCELWNTNRTSLPSDNPPRQPSITRRRHARTTPRITSSSRPLHLAVEPRKLALHLRYPRGNSHHLSRCHRGTFATCRQSRERRGRAWRYHPLCGYTARTR